MDQFKRVLTAVGLAIAIVVGIVVVLTAVIVGGYALYIWLAHPSSFAVPFTS